MKIWTLVPLHSYIFLEREIFDRINEKNQYKTLKDYFTEWYVSLSINV